MDAETIAAFRALVEIVGAPGAIVLAAIWLRGRNDTRFTEMQHTVERGFTDMAERIDKLVDKHAATDARVVALEAWKEYERKAG